MKKFKPNWFQWLTWKIFRASWQSQFETRCDLHYNVGSLFMRYANSNHQYIATFTGEDQNQCGFICNPGDIDVLGET